MQDPPKPAVTDAGAEAKATFQRSLRPEDASEYEGEKTKLLEEERRHESSWQEAARSRPLTIHDKDVETKANEIIFQVREAERVDPDLFGNLAGEDVPGEKTRDMGGRFLKNRVNNIDKSKLFKIACKLPKGAHLHLHFNSELRPEYLFPRARGLEDTFFFRTTRPLLAQDDFNETEIVFNVLDKTKITVANVFSEDYKPDVKRPESGTWMRWKDFRDQFTSHYPRGESGEGFKPEEGINQHYLTVPVACRDLDKAELWATEKMVITQDLKYRVACTHNDMWARFNRGTRAFKGLLNYEGIYRDYIGTAIDHMIKDGVMYAELRPMLMDKTIPTDDGTGTLDHRAQMNIVLEEVAKKQKDLGEKIEAFPFGLKIIYCAPRSIPRTRMQTELEDCIKLALQFKDQNLICGFDLVGAEDRPNNVGFYADQLRAFQRSCKELGLDIPFMFHAGETLLDTGGSDDPKKSNLYDAWLLGAKRIGHGYSILKHPMLVEKYRPAKKGEPNKKAIALELCPISNELLGLCGNAREHPFPALLAAGLHCTLNADNPSLFSSSLSHEFYQVMVGDTRMSLFGWRQLAEWSIEHSCLSDAEKTRGMDILHKRWRTFCQWVIDNEGTDFSADMPV